MLTDEPRSVNARRDHTTTIAVTVAILVVCVAVSFVPSEWSFVDDSAMKASVNANLERAGLLGGTISSIQGLAAADTGWGLFRPLWYVYGAVFYFADPGLAHGIRMVMFLAAVAIPALVVGRRSDGSRDYALVAWAAALLLLNSQLFQGLSFLSLQELTGVAFVALGLSTSHTGRRALAFLAAAWMKTPFVWLLLAYAAYLMLSRRTRTQGALAAVASVVTLGLAVLAAKRGTYTTSYQLDIAHMVQTLTGSVSLFAWPAVGAVLGAVLLRVDLRHLRWRTPMFAVFLLGGLGYFATLLPWGTTAYYGAPVVYLLSVAGLFLLSASVRSRVQVRRPVVAVALALALLAAVRMTFVMGTIQYERNATVVGLRDWAETLAPQGVTIGINGPEAAVRLSEIMVMRDAAWSNTIVYVTDTADQELDYYIQLEDQGAGNPAEKVGLERRLARAIIWRS